MKRLKIGAGTIIFSTILLGQIKICNNSKSRVRSPLKKIGPEHCKIDEMAKV